MKRVLTKKWFHAAGIRALKTVAQTALSMFTLGVAFNEVNWIQVASVAGVAGLYSLLTSVAGLPELDENETATAGN